MILNGSKNKKIARCAPIATQPATFDHTNTTSTATKSAILPLKALADKVLQRNNQRNQSATTDENRRNFCPQKSTQKLRPKSDGFLLATLEKACADLALQPQQLWRFLSPEDIGDIKAELIDSATLKTYAERWNKHPYLVSIGNDLAYPETPKPELVMCHACEHFQPDTIGDGHGIGECIKGVTGNEPLYPKAKRICQSFKEIRP